MVTADSAFPTTETKRLIDSEEWLRALSESVPVLVWCSGPDGLCTYFNNRWLEFTGRTLGESVGDGWAKDVHPEDTDRVVRDYYHSFRLRQNFRLEYRLRYRGGPYKWLVDFGSPVFGADQLFLGYIGGCLDVTAIKGHSSATSWREKFEIALNADLNTLGSSIWAAEVAIRDRLNELNNDGVEMQCLTDGLDTLRRMKKTKMGLD